MYWNYKANCQYVRDNSVYIKVTLVPQSLRTPLIPPQPSKHTEPHHYLVSSHSKYSNANNVHLF